MQSSDEARAAELLERLLTDDEFRASFRRDPASACEQFDLPELATEFGGGAGGSMFHTLEVRESRSSLAGAFMAAASEGTGAVDHLKNLHDNHLHGEAHRVVHHALTSPKLQAIDPDHLHGAGLTDHLAGSGSSANPASSTEITTLLSNTHLTFSPEAHAALARGGADARLVSVLDDLTKEHQLRIGTLQVSHGAGGDSFDILSVDGERVSQSNIYARDLANELASLDPSLRPAQIVTPWPIEAHGFTQGGVDDDRIHISFDAPSSSAPPAAHTVAGTNSPVDTSTSPDPGTSPPEPSTTPPDPSTTPPAAPATPPPDPSTTPPAAPATPPPDPSTPPPAAPATPPPEPTTTASGGYSAPPPPEPTTTPPPAPTTPPPTTVQPPEPQGGSTPPDTTTPPAGGTSPSGGAPPDPTTPPPEPTTAPSTPPPEPSTTPPAAPTTPPPSPATPPPVGGTPTPPEPATTPPSSPTTPPPEPVSPVTTPAAPPPPPTHQSVVLGVVQGHEGHSTFQFEVPGTGHAGAAAESALQGIDPNAAGGLPDASDTYPGDNASQQAIAAWMARQAHKAGLPAELPIMAALTESGLKNDNYGDRDSLGFFQMRTSIWNQGEYTGFPDHPELQLKWFINQALEVRRERLSQGDASYGQDKSKWGDWVADVEQPAAEYRGRYQTHLDQADSLLSAGGPGAAGTGGTAGPDAAAAAEALQGATGAAGSTAGVQALSIAERYLGTPYHWGGDTPQTGFDCSGLVEYSYAQLGIHVPRVAADQFDVGVHISNMNDLKPGDIVFFKDSTGYVHHEGLYIGNHMFLHAPHTGDVVKISSLDEPYYKEQFAGGSDVTGLASGAPEPSGAGAAPPVEPSAAPGSPAPEPAAAPAQQGTGNSGLFGAVQGGGSGTPTPARGGGTGSTVQVLPAVPDPNAPADG